MGRRSDINWFEIEVQYRAGLVAVRELSKQFGIAESNLRARAKREGWTRDGAQLARAAAQAAVAEQAKQQARAIGAAIGAQQALRVREESHELVLAAPEIVHEHRIAMRRGMNAAMTLQAELEGVVRLTELTGIELERCRMDDSARAALLERHLGLKAQMEMLDRWASTVSKLAAAEREAHDIGKEGSGESIDELLKRVRRDMGAPSAQ